MYDETELTALHESGHAVIADVLGRHIGLITAEPGDHASGRCWTTPKLVSAALPRTVEAPLLSWPLEWRERLADDVAVLLAGDMAEHLFARRLAAVTTRQPQPVAEQAQGKLEQLLLAAPEPTAAEREQAAAAVNAPAPSDASEIARLLAVAHGDSLHRGAAWLAWLEAETRDLLLASERRVRRMAALLAMRGTIGAEAIAACLRDEGDNNR